jgi:hypothetical protein
VDTTRFHGLRHGLAALKTIDVVMLSRFTGLFVRSDRNVVCILIW